MASADWQRERYEKRCVFNQVCISFTFHVVYLHIHTAFCNTINIWRSVDNRVELSLCCSIVNPFIPLPFAVTVKLPQSRSYCVCVYIYRHTHTHTNIHIHIYTPAYIHIKVLSLYMVSPNSLDPCYLAKSFCHVLNWSLVVFKFHFGTVI